MENYTPQILEVKEQKHIVDNTVVEYIDTLYQIILNGS